MHLDWSRRAAHARRSGPRAIAAVSTLAIVAGVAACGSSSPSSSNSGTSNPIKVVAAENEYGNVASQIGGKYVSVESIESNPNTDPHTYEVSPGVAKDVAAGQVLVENGVGYDTWMGTIASASPNSKRLVINAQHLRGLPDSTPNPHLWYSPLTMPVVAAAMASDFAKLKPAGRAYFKANLTKFDASLKPWLAAIAAFKAKYAGTRVATTEPVGDYMLQAVRTVNMTPWSLQAAIMNGTDPSPQDVTHQGNLFSDHTVKVFVYNQQVTDALTASFITESKQAGVPIIGVYETMPTPGYSYQTWMLAEVNALRKAVVDKVSTEKL